MDKMNIDYEFAVIQSYVQLLADSASPHTGRLDIDAGCFGYVMHDLSERLIRLQTAYEQSLL